jgi:hypothetical protein
MQFSKYILGIVFVLVISFQSGYGQSPYYSIEVMVPTEDGYTYSYSSSLCAPNPLTDRQLFTGSMSDVEWGKVDMNDYECSRLSNEYKEGFKYGNQIHVFEYIANVTIIRSDGENLDKMEIVFPFKMESFVTHVDLWMIEFKPGVYDLTDAFDYDTTQHLVMRVKDGYEWVDVSSSNLLLY